MFTFEIYKNNKKINSSSVHMVHFIYFFIVELSEVNLGVKITRV